MCRFWEVCYHTFKSSVQVSNSAVPPAACTGRWKELSTFPTNTRTTTFGSAAISYLGVQRGMFSALLSRPAANCPESSVRGTSSQALEGESLRVDILCLFSLGGTTEAGLACTRQAAEISAPKKCVSGKVRAVKQCQTWSKPLQLPTCKASRRGGGSSPCSRTSGAASYNAFLSSALV